MINSTSNADFVSLDISNPQWMELVCSDNRATVFHHPAWIELLANCYHYHPIVVAVLDKKGEIRAGLPVMEINIPFSGRRWVALPFSDYCSPLYRDDEALNMLFNRLPVLYKENHLRGLEVRREVPANFGLQVQAPYVLHTVKLEPDITLLTKRIHRTQMQNIRTAEKNEIRIEFSTDIQAVHSFYHLHCLTRRKHGVPVQPWKFFRLISSDLLAKGMGFVLLAFKGEACVAGGLFLHLQKTLTYKYSASDEEYLNLRPNHLLTWTALKWGCENDFTYFDFGRADIGDEGLREFKRRWGAEETPLAYSYLPSAPNEGGSGRFKSLLNSMIRRSPLWVCQLAGELLYRYAG